MGIISLGIGHWALGIGHCCESFLCPMRPGPGAMPHTINVLSNMTAAITQVATYKSKHPDPPKRGGQGATGTTRGAQENVPPL
jgi:hypothetical protein